MATILPHAGADAHAHYPAERRHPDHHWIRYRGCPQGTPSVEHALPLLHGVCPVFCGDDFLPQSPLDSAQELGGGFIYEATRPGWPLLRKDHLLRLPEGVSVRFLDALL